MEILKNKAFYISFLVPVLSFILFGKIWVGMFIVFLYGFFKSKDNIIFRAIFSGIILTYIIFLIFVVSIGGISGLSVIN